jgi:hypothetical protein
MLAKTKIIRSGCGMAISCQLPTNEFRLDLGPERWFALFSASEQVASTVAAANVSASLPDFFQFSGKTQAINAAQ